MKAMTQKILFKNAAGETKKGWLVSENKITAIVKPFLWIAANPIKIHKRKNHLIKLTH